MKMAEGRARSSLLSKSPTITIDDKYDLTLVVSSQDGMHGTKAFRVNSNVLRMASQPFNAMLSGRSAKTSKSEIEFPEDSCDAFLTILRIVHFKIDELPNFISKDDLLALAVLADKYDLINIVQPFVLTKWLSTHKGKSWSLTVDS